MRKLDWSAPAPPDIVARRAGGRARYNALRRDMAIIRRAEVKRLLATYGLHRGVQARIARSLM